MPAITLSGPKRRPLDVYTLSPLSGSASFFYRIDTVANTANELGLPVRFIIDRNQADIPPEQRVNMFCESDLILLYQPLGEGPINNVRGVQSFLPSKRDGEWKWSPTVVIETDDNLFNVSPLNQAYKTLGIRDMSGAEIPLGSSVGVVENGEKKVLYRDGANGFSLARNRQALASYRTLLTMADAVQCSTPNVEAAVRREVTPRRTRVFPNLVRMNDYPQVDLLPDPKKIKILWQGGIAHYEDFYPLREAFGRLTKKYPQVHWMIWGAQFPWVNELIPSHRYTFLPWCPYYEYKLRLVTIGHDISIAPLSSNVFNDCRSAIKWYEASVLRKPAATVAQRTAAYKAEIEDGKTALLFDTPEQFEEQVSRLIEDEMLRRTLAANAKDWVSENRDAHKHVPKVIQFWEELREERKLEQPHVTESEWEKIEAEMQQEQLEEAGV